MPVSDETKRKRSQYKPANTGKCVINNGQRNKFVLPEEVDKYLVDGWVLGRYDTPAQLGKSLSEETKRKISEAGRGRTPYNKGVPNPGFKNSGTWQKGHKPWNIGKTFSDESRAKMAAAKIGKRPKQSMKPVIWVEMNKTYEAIIDAVADTELGLTRCAIRDILKGKKVVEGRTLRLI